ncbi:MAG: FAD-binding protein [Chloroflexi bacterium]|nr:MAG: FAD-binding protein [Chloroflexota bacterium]
MKTLPIIWKHTLVIGSGAAGLNAAVQLHTQGIHGLAILTEGLQKSTSINTGSDKQTYYKISLYGGEADSPVAMAETYFAGGGMHGDLALVEASNSSRAFINLVNLGVPFPRDRFGQFIGYKTDHDPRRRATSIGPYTSREMCRMLIRRVEQLGIEVRENLNLVQLIILDEGEKKRVAGAVMINPAGELEVYGAENVVLAVGGPAGLYRTSVYPVVHTGAIGVALLAGARAQNLTESQYGMGSIKYRWNVSGTYMQVVPRLISTAPDGLSDEREFLREYFNTAGEMNSNVFLKGYQWPFDARKAVGGSSLIDILVYIESVLKERRVFLDFRRNAEGFSFDDLSEEAHQYLVRSKALQATPIERLRQMNPTAVELYREHGIDLTAEPLEIAVCAQHNNGGLIGNLWWESVNIRHLFPVGEVNGSHGVYRPGGASLNAGQVGSLRAADFISQRYQEWTVSKEAVTEIAAAAVAEILDWTGRCAGAATHWRTERAEFQARMSRAGAHIRSRTEIKLAVAEAREQWQRLRQTACACAPGELGEALRTRQLCFAHLVYLEAIRFALEDGVGSRGSSIVLDPAGVKIHDRLDERWCIAPDTGDFKSKVLETSASPNGEVQSQWVDCRPIPKTEAWFETTWAKFRNGEIYDA